MTLTLWRTYTAGQRVPCPGMYKGLACTDEVFRFVGPEEQVETCVVWGAKSGTKRVCRKCRTHYLVRVTPAQRAA